MSCGATKMPWKTFLAAHWDALAAADFFTVSRALYCHRFLRPIGLPRVCERERHSHTRRGYQGSRFINALPLARSKGTET
jgi:hypothetical protein